ncbi:MAG: hypothetical protein ACE5DQ_02720 [Candidatus Paceibacterota bacterium]
MHELSPGKHCISQAIDELHTINSGTGFGETTNSQKCRLPKLVESTLEAMASTIRKHSKSGVYQITPRIVLINTQYATYESPVMEDLLFASAYYAVRSSNEDDASVQNRDALFYTIQTIEPDPEGRMALYIWYVFHRENAYAFDRETGTLNPCTTEQLANAAQLLEELCFDYNHINPLWKDIARRGKAEPNLEDV